MTLYINNMGMFTSMQLLRENRLKTDWELIETSVSFSNESPKILVGNDSPVVE